MGVTYTTTATNTYTPIATYTAPSAQANYTFSSIPATYTDLVLIINGGESVNTAGTYIRFNGDTAANYSYTTMNGTGSTTNTGRDVNGTFISIDGGVGFSTTMSASTLIMNIMNYSNTTTNKIFIQKHGNVPNGSYPGANALVGQWRNTAAISTILLYISGATTWSTGTTFTLYGIKAA